MQQTIQLQLQGRFRHAVFAEARNRDEALRQCKQMCPVLIVLDSDLDDCDGLQLIEDFLRITPSTRIVVYSGHIEAFTVYRVSKSRAKGFVAKGEKAGELGDAAVKIMADGRYYSESIRIFLQDLAIGQHAFASRLTDRLMEMLGEMGCGLTDEEIAVKYSLSPRTVRNHRAEIMEKLELPTTGKLVAYAFDNGFTRKRANGSLRPTAPLSIGHKPYD